MRESYQAQLTFAASDPDKALASFMAANRLMLLVSAALLQCAAFVPAASAQMITSIDAKRDESSGAIMLSGMTTLPQGTRLRVWVSAAPDIVRATVDGRGTFAVKGIGEHGRPLADTAMVVHVQTDSGPAGRSIESKVAIRVPPMSDATLAKRLETWTPDSLLVAGASIVESVRRSLFHRDDGLVSSVNIEAAIHWHEWTGQFVRGTWYVQQLAPSEWRVVLTGRQEKERVVARWSYNGDQSLVRALDPLAADLSYRHVSVLSCVIDEEAKLGAKSDRGAAKPSVPDRLVIIPLPAPDIDRGYSMQADFVVDAQGKAELLEFTRPNDPVWARKIAAALRGYRFRPALDYDGKPACGRSVVRVSLKR